MTKVAIIPYKNYLKLFYGLLTFVIIFWIITGFTKNNNNFVFKYIFSAEISLFFTVLLICYIIIYFPYWTADIFGRPCIGCATYTHHEINPMES